MEPPGPSATLRSLPLRERKHARTRLDLLEGALERIEARSLESLPVKELCEAAQVSEATFFNYFPRKSDLMAYAGQLFSLDLVWHGRQAARQQPGLDAVGTVFERAARRFQERPGFAGELIAHQAVLREREPVPEIGRAERLMAFPEREDILALKDAGLDALLYQQLEQAVTRGELPANAHLQTVLVSLVDVFYGVPLALRLSNPQGIGTMYRRQLTLLWAGVRAAAGGQ